MNDLNSLAVPTKWTLEDALGLIRALQPQTRKWGYHLCLGGGVMNRGYSEKDLDLYFLPMGGRPSDSNGLVGWLAEMWGPGTPIGGKERPTRVVRDQNRPIYTIVEHRDVDEYPDEPPYIWRLTYSYGKQRIDVFVLGTEEHKREQIAMGEETEEAEQPAVPERIMFAEMPVRLEPGLAQQWALPTTYTTDWVRRAYIEPAAVDDNPFHNGRITEGEDNG